MSRRSSQTTRVAVPDRVAPISSAAALGDKPCIYCGGSLDGQTAADRCPNCGKLAIDSLLGSHLRDVDQYWLRIVWRGIGVLMAGFGLFLIVRAFQIVETLDPGQRWFEHKLLRYLASVISWSTVAVAAWMVTAPERSDHLIARRRGVPRLIRIAAILAAGFAAIPQGYLDAMKPWPLYEPLFVVWSLSILLCHVLLWLVLRRLIDRTPRDEVRRKLVLIAWLCVPILLIASPATWMLIERGGFDASQQRAMKVAMMSLLAAYHVASIVLLLMTTHAIRRTVGYWS